MSLCSCSQSTEQPVQSSFTAGTYEVSETGINEFTLFFTFSEDALTDIEVIEENETFGTGKTAIEKGMDVILLESTDLLGGTSMGAAYLVGGSTNLQKELGVDCTQEDVTNWLMTRTGETSDDLYDPEWNVKFSEGATETINWLIDQGVKLNKIDPSLSRAHVSSDYTVAGNAMLDGLSAKLEELNADVRLGNKASELIVEDGKVTGVVVETSNGTYSIHAENVLLCTGGYFANQEMVKQYFTEFVDLNLPSDARIGSDGSGMLMAQEAGAQLANMNEGNVFPFAVNVNGVEYNTPLGFIWMGGIAVNQEGQRFTDETAKYLTVSKEILKQTDAQAYVVFDQTTFNTASATSADQLNQLMINGLIEKYDTLEELAAAHQIPADQLTETVAHYTELVHNGADTDFNRPYYYMQYSDMATAPYYVVKTEMCLHTSWGGIVTDIHGQVLNEQGEVIDGLYAAGECTQSKVQGNGSATQGPVWGRISVDHMLSE